MSAEIIPFIPSEYRRSRPNDAATAFRSAIEPDDLAMDHVDAAAFDTAPCEYVRPCEETDFIDPGA